MYFKFLLTILTISSLLFADFYDQIEKIDKQRDKDYKELNKTLKMPDTSKYIDQINSSMKDLKQRIDSYEKDVYGGATKKEILANLKNNPAVSREFNINLDDFIKTNRIYVFMSSSVPQSVWYQYGEFLFDNKLTNSAMLLRGCIGGCEKIMPTLTYMKNILEYKKNKKINPTIMIDPLLFKRYKIEEVPCVVFAKNISYNDNTYTGSEGNEKAVKNGKIYKSCGDWNMLHHLEELEKQSKDPTLKQIISKTNRERN